MQTFLNLLLVCCITVSVYGWNENFETPGMYQGDIQLTPEQWERVRNGHTFGSIRGGRWPGGKIPYVIESSIGSRGRQAIDAAISDYHKYTCLRFHKRTNERNYISFYNGRGCNSPVGMSQHYKNRISLQAGGCQDKGTALHEIGHSIGLHHEQGRADRDQYVTIHYNNINGPWAYAFNKKQNLDSLGTPYDLHSMMHYSSTAFAKRGKKTITTNDPSKQHIIDTYNRISGFSQMDIKQINLMYKKECGGTGGGGTLPTLPPTSCDNKDSNCDKWAKSGYCTNKYGPWMKDNCCKACKDNGSSSCSDNNSRCAEWAGRGECKKNPSYMLRECKKSCNSC